MSSSDLRWRCSEWHDVLKWYYDRSDVVHGGELRVEDAEAGKTLFWLVTRLPPTVLEWYAAHPGAPIQDLDHAIDALPDVVGSLPPLSATGV